MSFSITFYIVMKKDAVIVPENLVHWYKHLGENNRTAGEAWYYFLNNKSRDRKYWYALGFRARRFQITFEEMPANAKRTGKRVRLV